MCSIGKSEPIEFLIDSGADANIIGGNDWNNLQKQVQKGLVDITMNNPSKTTNLRAYAAKNPMYVECSFSSTINALGTGNPSITAQFLVVPSGHRSLLGRATSGDMRLLKVGASINSCGEVIAVDVFPKMPGVLVKFSINKSVAPVRNAYYNVPAAYREGARQRLREMEQRGIIERVTTAPEWISGMSAVPKGKNDFRLVVNMRAANKAINREYFRLPLLHEMKTKLHGARYFTKLDLTSAYYHLELAKDSRDVTTFLTEEGMFRFTRLMFGVNCAPEIFQREMTRVLEGIPNIIIYIDDILVFAGTIEELRATVNKILELLRTNNLTLNESKCEYDKERVNFLGHELDKEGFHIDSVKTKHIEKFRPPETPSELRSFLGLAAYVSPYIQNFSDLTNPLWTVSTTRTWSWGPQQSAAFEATKKAIADCTIALGYFSEEDKTVLYTDASPVALGAVLVQENTKSIPRIISFASKALTPTEQKYAQNQREALGAVWAVEYFSYYLLGRDFTLRTDAKGVAFILNRSRETSKRVLTRADGWALRLSPYSYKVEYVEGKFNIADPSSRLYDGKDEPFDESTSPWEIAKIEANAISLLTDEEVRSATREDDVLSQVTEALESGEWPKNLHRYKQISEDLCVDDGIITKNGMNLQK